MKLAESRIVEWTSFAAATEWLLDSNQEFASITKLPSHEAHPHGPELIVFARFGGARVDCVCEGVAAQRGIRSRGTAGLTERLDHEAVESCVGRCDIIGK